MNCAFLPSSISAMRYNICERLNAARPLHPLTAPLADTTASLKSFLEPRQTLASFSPDALVVLSESVRHAVATRSDNIRTPHLFMGLLSFPDSGVIAWGQSLKADLNELSVQFQELFHQDKTPEHTKLFLHREFLSDQVIELIRDAKDRSSIHARKTITPMDLLISLLTDSDSVVIDCFQRIGITAAKLTEYAVLAECRFSVSDDSGMDAA